jgi:TM2 domain-containing membrane protein YozV
MRILSLVILFLFVNNIMVSSKLYSLTVEEEAGFNKKRIYNESKIEYKRPKNIKKVKVNEQIYGKKIFNRVYVTKNDKKDPRLACLLSVIIPGSGHIYLRRDLKGIGFCVATGSGYIATGVYAYKKFLGSGKDDSFKSKVIVTSLMFFVSTVLHVVGIVEAYADTEEINKKNEYYKRKLITPYSGDINYE